MIQRRSGVSSPVHFQRSVTLDGRRTIIVLAPYNARLAHALETRVPPEYRVHHIAAGVWEIDEWYEGAVWWGIAEGFGLNAICPWCLQENCQELYQLVLNNVIVAALENMRRQWAYQPKERGSQYRLPTSTDVSISLRPHRPVERRTPAGVAASILGVEWPASREQVIAAFRRAALRAHSDMGGSDEEMRKVLIARDVLLG